MIRESDTKVLRETRTRVLLIARRIAETNKGLIMAGDNAELVSVATSVKRRLGILRGRILEHKLSRPWPIQELLRHAVFSIDHAIKGCDECLADPDLFGADWLMGVGIDLYIVAGTFSGALVYSGGVKPCTAEADWK